MSSLVNLEKEISDLQQKNNQTYDLLKKRRDELKRAAEDRICEILTDAGLDFDRDSDGVHFDKCTITEYKIFHDQETIRVTGANASEHVELVENFIKTYPERLKAEKAKREEEEKRRARAETESEEREKMDCEIAYDIARNLPVHLLAQTFIQNKSFTVGAYGVNVEDGHVKIYAQRHSTVTYSSIEVCCWKGTGYNVAKEAIDFLLAEFRKAQPWMYEAASK